MHYRFTRIVYCVISRFNNNHFVKRNNINTLYNLEEVSTLQCLNIRKNLKMSLFHRLQWSSVLILSNNLANGLNDKVCSFIMI